MIPLFRMSLNEAISNILSPFPSRKYFIFVFERFHKMAIAYLYTKQRSGTLATHLIQLTIEDFAVDCIAELFERDGKNRFIRLIEYYDQYSIQGMDEIDLEGISRRLVFSEVSNRIFKSYGEADPNLRKVIRNLKDIEPSSQVLLKQIGDKWWVCFDADEPLVSSLPLMPPELLEAYITPLLAAERNLKSLLNRLSEEFLSQTVYRRAYPLVGFARVLLSASSKLDQTGSSEPPNLHQLQEEDLRRLIAESIRVVKAQKHRTYVGKKKIDEETFATYFDVIAEYLENEFIHSNGNEDSLFTLLSKRIEGLTKDNYQENRRVYLEFLLKETRQVFIKMMKREL